MEVELIDEWATKLVLVIEAKDEERVQSVDDGSAPANTSAGYTMTRGRLTC